MACLPNNSIVSNEMKITKHKKRSRELPRRNCVRRSLFRSQWLLVSSRKEGDAGIGVLLYQQHYVEKRRDQEALQWFTSGVQGRTSSVQVRGSASVGLCMAQDGASAGGRAVSAIT